MSNRKKRHTKKQDKAQQTLILKEYSSSGELRFLPTDRLTSGQPYQRPVEEKDVDDLIRK